MMKLALSPSRTCLGLLLLIAAAATTPTPAAAQGRSSARASAEDEYYRLITIPIPEGIVFEVGGLTTLPDGRLAATTRRGEVWIIENPDAQGATQPHFTRFAHGLHEPLGLAYHDGALYTAQRGELTRLRDTNGDGRADRYETVYRWPLSGNYHEYSYGPVFAPNGNMIVTLNLAWVGYGASLAKWRGWALEITPDGKMTPIATGMRSPAGFGFNLEGDLFYAENQGDWVGSGGITHVEKGDFVGNPAGLRWTDDPQSPLRLRPEDVPSTGEPKFDVARRVPHLKTPAVWFPHGVLGISTSDILVDSTGGRFGPFAGQLFVGDQGQSKIMRVYLEKVDGVYQGVVFPFREGLSSGVLRLTWGKDGSMFIGMTNRGWASTGRAPFGLQRLVWTGKVPFEAEKIEARPDGFEITFTLPVDRRTAGDPASYRVSGFTYRYHSAYGSPVINQQTHPVRAVVVSEDGRRARLVVDGLRLGYIHEIQMSGVRSENGQPLLHDVAYYTLNRIPAGERVAIKAAAPAPARQAARPTSTREAASLARRQTSMPADWNGRVDATITIGTQPGMRFDLTQFRVKAGSRVRLDFNNQDDMLHNLLVVRPGREEQVARAALDLGLEGLQREYVPPSDDVLFHTGLLQPGTSETIYFVAPETPGDYPYLCTFPGHAPTMRGTMTVVP
ncbi:MAG TPA: plastocyanin/azurin family copper-binding protein [Longimicrobiales bacterium]